MLGSLGLTMLGREAVNFLELPIYLDMVGTAVAAVVLGPWRGAAVGLSTNLLGSLTAGAVSLPFAIVNVVGALIWGYGVHRWGMGRTLSAALDLNVEMPRLRDVRRLPPHADIEAVCAGR